MSKQITPEDVAKSEPKERAQPIKLDKQQAGDMRAMLARVTRRAKQAKHKNKRNKRDVRRARKAKREARRRNR